MNEIKQNYLEKSLELLDYYEGFLKGMEDVYNLVVNEQTTACIPDMSDWDYDILTNSYSVGYFDGYVYYYEYLRKNEDSLLNKKPSTKILSSYNYRYIK